MLDKSGNGNHVSNTGTHLPVLQNDGTNNYLQFTSASTQYLQRASETALAPRTDSWFSVCGFKFDSSTVSQTLYARSEAGANTGRYANFKNSSNAFTAFFDPNGSGGGSGGVTDTNTTTRVSTATIDRTALTANERINASSTGTASFATSGNLTSGYRFLVGAYNDSSDTGQQGYLNGRIYGLVLRFATIDTTLRGKTETWVGGKCGVVI